MLIKNNFIYAKESRQLVSPTEAKSADYPNLYAS
ncbi:unknown [Clostridium sp. CAG:354]|nr:unknown [Clostridium sp. CAG:354]